MTIVHPSDEKVIRYVRGRLGAPGSPPVVRLEEHLLDCPVCILRAERAVEFGQALRTAVATLREEEEREEKEREEKEEQGPSRDW